MKHILKPWKENEELSIEDALKELENYETPTQAPTHEIKFKEYKIDTFEFDKNPLNQNYVDLINFQTPFGVFDKLRLFRSAGKFNLDDIKNSNSKGVPPTIIPLWLDFGARYESW